MLSLITESSLHAALSIKARIEMGIRSKSKCGLNYVLSVWHYAPAVTSHSISCQTTYLLNVLKSAMFDVCLLTFPNEKCCCIAASCVLL